MKKTISFLLLLLICCDTIHAQTTWGNNSSRTEWRDNAGLQGDQGAVSGFYETVNPVNYPQGASSWWHLLDVRHSNTGNNYAMQFSGSFYDQQLFFRKTNGSATQPWSRVVTELNNGASIGNGSGAASLLLNDIEQARYLLNTGNYGFHIQKNTGGNTWATRFMINQSGDIGIGLNGAEMKLDILTSRENDGINLRYNNVGFIRIHSNSMSGGGWNGITQAGDGGIIYGPNANFGFVLAPASNLVSGLRMDKEGNIGVATSDTKGYKLAVNGSAIFTKVLVKQYGSWPDYVFASDYTLRSLQEVEAFIKKYKHLPGVPSAREVEEQGLDVGESQATLLKKIEELTLYLLELKKENDQIKEELTILKSSIK